MVMQVLDSLALFPLADVVLLPDVSVPLYIFEPRYRQMTRDALGGDRRIGMVAVRPDAVSRMSAEPPIFGVGCMGRIVESQAQPDGTFHMILQGEARFRVLEERPSGGERLYRVARVELLRDIEPQNDSEREQLATTRDSVLDLLTSLVRQARPDHDIASYVRELSSFDSGRLINTLTQSIAFDPIERQQLLEADSIFSRFETMEELLRFRIAASGTPSFGDSGKLN